MEAVTFATMRLITEDCLVLLTQKKSFWLVSLTTRSTVLREVPNAISIIALSLALHQLQRGVHWRHGHHQASLTRYSITMKNIDSKGKFLHQDMYYNLSDDFIFYLQLRFSTSNLQATKSLLKCLNHRCCPSSSPSQFPIPVRRSEDEGGEQKFAYNTEGDERPKQFSGTFDQFKRNVLDKDDTIVGNK